MDLSPLQHKLNQEIKGYSYKNIPIFCTPNVHEKIFSDFISLNPAKNSNILVLGCGAGAFDQRLVDSGYSNVTSVDYSMDGFMASGSKFEARDLNKDFSDLGKFDYIFAIELIEHLENHFHFIRCIKNLLNENGYFYVSTPNVENTFARMKYLLTSNLNWFTPEQMKGTGHINPVFNHILGLNLEMNGLKIDKTFSNGNVWSLALKHPKWSHKVLYAIVYPFTYLMRNRDNMDIKIFRIV